MQSIENEILCICCEKLTQLNGGMQMEGWYLVEKRNGVDLQLSNALGKDAVVPQTWDDENMNFIFAN